MNSEDNSIDAMSSEFIAEIKDDLASLEPDLLIMEEKGAKVDDDLINHAFRSIHSIKGGAGFISFKELSSLSHDMENVLMRVREKTLVITSEIVDALLSGFDKMKLMVESMGTGAGYEFEEQKAVLQKILAKETPEDKENRSVVRPDQPKPEGSGKNQSETKFSTQKDFNEKRNSLQAVKPIGNNPFFIDIEFFVDKDRLENALNSQKFVYAVHIRFETDLTAKQKDVDSVFEDIKSIGDILFTDLEERTEKPSKNGFFCVVATILDLPLLSQVLEISKTQMALVDRQFTDYETILKGLSPTPGLEKTSGLEKSKNVSLPPEPTNATSLNFNKDTNEAATVTKMSTASTAQTIRINVDLISRLMNRTGEMVIVRKQLRPLVSKHIQENSPAYKMMQNLDIVTTDIQEAIMQMRMQPIIDLMGKYKRVVRDIARRISKKVDFILDGADVEVDRNVLEKLANPVTHLIRNCIDHGIESTEERKRLSKPEAGTISVKAFHQGGHVHIIISDDGAGIDPQLVLSKAFEKGLVVEDQLDKLSDTEKIDLIFLPGFSTSEEITDISGRGVGMDVVKTNIMRLRGQIEIDSVKGEGTSVHLIIPLTLAIVPSLIVSSGDAKFAIPQVNIKEVIYLEPGEIHRQVENIAGSEVLRLREHLVPILRLRNVLGIKTYIQDPGAEEKKEEKRKAIADRRQKLNVKDTSDKRHQKTDRRSAKWDSTYIILLKLGGNVFGLCVDELYDIEEVVVEPLSEYLKHLKSFAGATILGDGNVIMILDAPGIAAFSHLKFDSVKDEELKRNRIKEKKAKEKGKKRSLIVFSNSHDEYFALELKHTSRLEPVQASDIHNTGELKYVEHNNQAVLLFSMDEFGPASKCELKDEEIFIIFPKHISVRVGIIASKIIDTIETDEKLNRDATSPGHVMGKIFIDNIMVQVLDHEKLADLIEHKATIAKDIG